MHPSRWYKWQRYEQDGGYGLLESDGIFYRANWGLNTLADRLINHDDPLPAPGVDSRVPQDAPGVLIDKDEVTPLDAAAVAKIRSRMFPSEEEIEAFDRNMADTIKAENAAAAVSEIFLSLTDLTGEIANHQGTAVDTATGESPGDHSEDIDLQQGEYTIESGLHAGKYYLKPPRSVKEIKNLLAMVGVPHVVQVAGRAGSNLVLKHAGTSAIPHKIAPASWKRKWILHLAQALAALHEKGITHNDLSFNNFVVNEDKATLVDLESGPHTSGYLAPEGFHADYTYDKRADVYGFGMLLWSIENHNMPRSFMTSCMVCSGVFGDLMVRCIAYEPEARPTMKEVLAEIEGKLAGLGELEGCGCNDEGGV